MRLRRTVGAAGLFGVLAVACGKSANDIAPGPPPVTGTGATAPLGTAGPNADGGAAGADAESQARLQPWQLEAEGTQPLVLGVFDTQENVHCEFLLDSEGQLRCLPARLPSLKLWEVGNSHEDQSCVYAGDAQVFATYRGGPVSLPLPRHGCEQRYVVATLSVGQLDGLATNELRDVCAEETPGSWGPVFTPVTIASVISPSRWVAATRVGGPVISPRLHLGRFRGADGSIFDDQVIDERWGTSCALAGTEEFPVGCLPPHLAFETSTFLDQTCSSPLWRLPACAPETYIGGGSDRAGDHPARALGPAYVDQVYGLEGHGTRTCVAEEKRVLRSGEDSFFSGGEPLAADATEAPFSWLLQGTGRLQRRGIRGADDAFIPIARSLIREPLPYYDTVAGTACSPLQTATGGVRCVPPLIPQITTGAPEYGIYYADPQCSQPAYFCFPEACNSGVAVLLGPGSDLTAVGLSLVTTSRPPQTYSKQAEGCLAVPEVPTLTLGDATPWDRFPELRERNGTL